MTSEHFSGHTLTKVRNLIKKGVTSPIIYRDKDTTGLAIKVTKTGANWFFSTRDRNLAIATADLARVRNNIVQRGKNGEAKGQGI